MMTDNPSGPLTGLRVFDLMRVLAGPICVQLLGDMGAEVGKIVKSGSGDDTRGFARPGTGLSAYFARFNRNERSVTSDIFLPRRPWITGLRRPGLASIRMRYWVRCWGLAARHWRVYAPTT